MNKTFLTLAAFFVLAPVGAQMPGAKVLTATASVSPKAIAPGGKGILTLTLSVAPRFHINAAKPSDPSLIPTTFTATAPAGWTLGAAKFPAAKTVKATYSPTPIRVYMGKSIISVPFTVSKSAKPGRATVGGTVGYQGCNESACFPPASLPVKAVVTVK